MSSRLIRTVSQPVDIVFRPSALVEGYVSSYSTSLVETWLQAGRLSAYYVLNLVLYAIPLTLAGYGVASTAQAPPLFAALFGAMLPNPDPAFQFLASVAQNGAYLVVASALTLVTYHVGIRITRSSRGFMQSLHTVVYSTGIYLALIFTLVWYLSQAEAIVVADQVVLNFQKELIYAFIDLFQADLALPAGRPTAVDTTRLTLQGKLALTGIVAGFCYYAYALYLGARINHRASRVSSLLAVAFVAISPALYISGSILAVTGQFPVPM
ncbi:hypothetical protein ACKVMT_17460 [Halobacteriales archaeon Cl-PHB]